MKKLFLVLAVLFIATATTYSQIAIVLEKDIQKAKPVQKRTRIYEPEPEETGTKGTNTRKAVSRKASKEMADLQEQLNKLSYGNGRTSAPVENKKKI